MAREVRTDFTVFTKTDEEVTIKNVDFAGNDLAEGETISEVLATTLTPADGDLTVDGTALEDPPGGTIVQVTLSGGVLGTSYKLVVKARTSNFQELEAAGIVYVGDP